MEIRVKSGELLSLRAAARNLYEAVTRLEQGDVEKFVLLDQKNVIRAIVISPDAYDGLVKAAAMHDKPQSRAA